MPTFAGEPVTKEQIRGTKNILAYYTRFLASTYDRCRDPEDRYFPGEMTKDQARRRLKFLIDTAINRKAGIPDVVGRKQEPRYQDALRRECLEVREHFGRRRALWGLNGRRFETDIIQKRYGHLLDGSNE